MAVFRCYVMGGAGQIMSVDCVEAEDDASALQLADELRKSKHGEDAKIEVWDLARCLGRIDGLTS